MNIKRGRKSRLPERVILDSEDKLFKYSCEGKKFNSLKKIKEYFGNSKFVRSSNKERKPSNPKLPKEVKVLKIDNDSFTWEDGREVVIFGIKHICRKDSKGQYRYMKS